MSAGERAPRLERGCSGLYWVRDGEGEAAGWTVEQDPAPRPPQAVLGLPWVVTDRQGRLVGEYLTLADARGNLPPVPAGKRRSLGTLSERKPR